MTSTCWDLALAAAGHHDGTGGLALERQEPHELFQVSTAGALVAGGFRGCASYGEIRRHGDFGVGTFDCLDGEMVAVGGEFFQLRSDGTARPVTDVEQAPFAMVTFFCGDSSERIDEPVDHAGLLARLDTLIPDQGGFFAVQVDGQFSSVLTRTVSRQSEPFPTLAEACADQTEVTMVDVSGTLVGFRAPRYADGVTLGGYHFHFITDDRTRGGHVLDCRVAGGVIRFDSDSEFHIELPQTG